MLEAMLEACLTDCLKQCLSNAIQIQNQSQTFLEHIRRGEEYY